LFTLDVVIICEVVVVVAVSPCATFHPWLLILQSLS